MLLFAPSELGLTSCCILSRRTPLIAESPGYPSIPPSPSLHFITRSRSLQPGPVGFVPPRSSNLDYACHSESAGVVMDETAVKVALIANVKTTMSFIKEFEVELKKKFESSESSEAIVRWISEKVLESYK